MYAHSPLRTLYMKLNMELGVKGPDQHECNWYGATLKYLHI